MKRVITIVVSSALLAACQDFSSITAPDALDMPSLAHAAAGACVVAPAGLVSWWPGNGDASDIIGDNEGTAVGIVDYAHGMVGDAFSFGGFGVVTVLDHSTLNINDAMTVELWFNSMSLDDVFSRGLIAKRVGSLTTANYGVNLKPSEGLGLYYNDPFTVGGGDDDPVFGFETIRVLFPSANVFHHFAGSYKQVDTDSVQLTVFVDGVFQDTVTLGGRLENTLNGEPLTIGASNSSMLEAFDGLIDEVSIYDRVLSDIEVQSIYDAGAAGKCTTPPPPPPPPPPLNIDVSIGGNGRIKCRGRNSEIPVVIYTTDEFDATSVDHMTVQLGPDGATERHRRRRGVRRHEEDVDNDGDTDLVLHFRFRDTGLQCGDTEATLIGETFEGRSFTVTSEIETNRRGRGRGRGRGR